MNAFTKSEAAALPVRLSSPYARTAIVEPYGFPAEVSYEYQEGESAIVTGQPDDWHPGSPANVVLLSCRIGGIDVTDMLSSAQVERYEEAVLEQYE